jgi:hypothetical protein
METVTVLAWRRSIVIGEFFRDKRRDALLQFNPRFHVGTGFGPVAFVAFGLRLGHEAGGLRPPLASPAPTSLACPHAEE